MAEVTIAGCRGVELCLSWCQDSDGRVPDKALEASKDCYVARAMHNGKWTPGKLVRGHKCAYVSYGGKEHSYKDYEVLVRTDVCCYGSGHSWVQAGPDGIPNRALLAGTDDTTPLFVARAMIDNEMCAGKFHLGQKKAYFPRNGTEHTTKNYDVLVFNANYS